MTTREQMLDRVRKALGRPDTGSVVAPLAPLDLAGVMPPLAPDDYLAKFEALIESYNAGSRNIDEMFNELVAFSRALSEEEHRHVRENLSEEELTVFDILTRPGPELPTAERDEVKRVAKALLGKVKALVVLNWRQKAQARAQVLLAIEDTLDEGLPASYGRDLYHRKVGALFEHVYESYQGEGASIYTTPA